MYLWYYEDAAVSAQITNQNIWLRWVNDSYLYDKCPWGMVLSTKLFCLEKYKMTYILHMNKWGQSWKETWYSTCLFNRRPVWNKIHVINWHVCIHDRSYSEMLVHIILRLWLWCNFWATTVRVHLGCDAMWTHKQIPTFQGNIPSSSSGLHFSEKFVSTYKTTQHYNPQERHWHFHCHGNLKYHSGYRFFLCQYSEILSSTRPL
jgi:hypothetical protein